MAKDKSALKVLSGIVLIAVLNIVAVLLIFSVSGPVTALFPVLSGSYGIPYMIMVFGGLSFYQLLYVIPLSAFLRRRNEESIVKGIIMGAVLTSLLCSACFLVLFNPF